MWFLWAIKSVHVQARDSVSAPVSMAALLKLDSAHEAPADPDKMQVLIHAFLTRSQVTLRWLGPHPYLGPQAAILRCAALPDAIYNSILLMCLYFSSFT